MKSSVTVPETVSVASLSRAQTNRSILVIAVLFFVFGFVTWINAILIPYFKIACELSNFQSYFVTFAFYISYFVMSVPASYLIRAVGFRKSIQAGFMTMAIGAFTFIPAAYGRTYEIFLLGLFTIGIGLAILQSAANPYITILGPKERAAQRISIMGICNKGAGILAPLIFSAFLLRPEDNELIASLPTLSLPEKEFLLDGLIHRVIIPYLCLGFVLVILGVVVKLSPLPEISTDGESTGTEEETRTSIFQYPYLLLGAVAIFVHVGTHVMAIDTVIGYSRSMGLPLSEARVFPSYTLFATLCGYIIGIILIPRLVSQLKMFRGCALLGAGLSAAILLVKGETTILGHTTDISLWFVVLLGLANSLIWAGIWPLALDNLGRFTKLGASILIMGLSGQAVMPLIYGRLADLYSDRTGYVILIPCYLYLVFYAFTGYRIRHWRRPPDKFTAY